MPACSEKSKFKGNSDYICNPVSGRYVKKTGAIGKKLLNVNVKRKRSKVYRRRSKALRRSKASRRSRRKVQGPQGKDRKSCAEELTKGGKLLGSGREGEVYALGTNKVIKLAYSKSKNKPFGPGQRKRFENEVKWGKEIANKNIGPKIYNHGICKYASGGETAYFEMEKLDKPKTSKKLCTPQIQKQFFKLFKDLSKLKLTTNDVNINNFMVKNGKFYLIDLGRAKKLKSVEAALQANLSVLIGVSRTISGNSLQGAAGLGWRCKNLDSLVGLIYEYVDDSKLKFLRLSLKGIKISSELREEIEK